MNYKIGCIIGVVASLVLSGCSTLRYERIASDGTTISSSSRSFLHKRTVKQFSYDDKTGTLTVDTSESSPDSESIAKLCDTVSLLVGAIAK